MESFADRIKSFRIAHSLTQREMAAKLGVSFATINRWENSQTEPSPLALAKLDALEMELGKPSARSGRLTEQELTEIISRYSSAAEILRNSVESGGSEPLWSRLERAAMDQAVNAEATVSRYAIWANTMRDNIRKAIELIREDKDEEAIRVLTGTANSLAAFAEIQSRFVKS